MAESTYTRASVRGGRLATVAFFCLALTSGVASATASSHEVRSGEFLTVCGDPANLPFSNSAAEGFENKVAQLIADQLGRPLRYRWWPQTIGFVRNTLRLRLCDLILGITSVNELVQNTNPYYRSVYTLVSRASERPAIESIRDPRLADLRLGVVAGTPPATLLSRYGLMANTRPYLRTVDTRNFSPAREALEAVANSELDVAIIWGPIAGYYAGRLSVPLAVVPLPAEQDGVPLAFNVSMGLRHRESRWKHQLNGLLETLEPQIRATLLEYGVPLLDANDVPITR